ncbi:MAG: aspartate aminotransferase family protein [Bacteroidetes bacterium]|nr:aspartate aminotransferase family protein [Bacteroidota bacterium]
MITNRQLFLNHLAQTSPLPLGIEVSLAEGSFLFDPAGKKYIDLVAGVSVSNVGHRHPKVVKAIHEQLERYMHVMVYGEFILSPQTKLAEKIASLLPPTLNCTYFTNSGTEAVEGAMKLAKRVTGRTEIISFHNAYHGSTQGALSIMGSEFFKTAFRPLLPGTKQIPFNDESVLKEITEKTACVIAEPIQGEAGAVVPAAGYLEKLRERCKEKGALLIFDEIQTGFGRTGKMFGFENSSAIPDVIIFAKGLGGGLPIGAFVSSIENMSTFTNDPVLGHITTFGGNPVCCAAALATIGVIQEENIVASVERKEQIIRKTLSHKNIISLRGKGMLYALSLKDEAAVHFVIREAIHRGVITDWFLFNMNSIRIAPPLNIDDETLEHALKVLLEIIDKI